MGINMKKKPSASIVSYKNLDLSIEERVKDLISRMTLEEKVSQMLHSSPAIERLDVPAYNWWNECLHGVARAGIATVFPQAIGLAAMWNDEFLLDIAKIISDEARAKHHMFLKEGDISHYSGLTFWTPNVNIFRDPRWGRGQETYGECPHLTGRMGVAFCKGLQGNDEKYLKLVATPKHYAVHSGPEGERHTFNARVSQKDLRETYLPAFHECIVEAKAHSIMGAYNRTNGEVCCGSKTLLQKILRDEWGFEGYVVSDCWAIKDFHENHKITENGVQSAAYAVKNGCDLNCGCIFEKLIEAVKQGLLEEEKVDQAVSRLFYARFKLGMFDPEEIVSYAHIPYEINDCYVHRKAALEAAKQSMVLLKNDGILPLNKNIKSIAVIGPNAYNHEVLLGNYNGLASKYVTPLDGIRNAVSNRTKVWYAEGCELTGDKLDWHSPNGRISEALAMARRSDAVVVVTGLSSHIEGEEGEDTYADSCNGDKFNLSLPGLQERLIKEVSSVGKPTVLVNITGSAMDLRIADEEMNAVIQAWYPGEEAGTALADILFGEYSPAGRLPVTFYKSVDDLPDFKNYDMENRTYRYFEGEPLYPFGFGLSYTSFSYSNLRVAGKNISIGNDTECTISFDVKNTGNYHADEVIQLYVSAKNASVKTPKWDLKYFKRIHAKIGEIKPVSLKLPVKAFTIINNQGERVLEPGSFDIFIGGSLPDKRSIELTKDEPLKTEIFLEGKSFTVPY
jgi:beta-glucosidase